MKKITFIQVTDPITEEVIEHAIIDHGDGNFTSMLKSVYEAQQTEIKL
jgi:hypothetical protein